MTDAHSLTAENLLSVLPQVLQDDEGMKALASAVVEIFAKRQDEIDLLRIYPQIDNLPEGVLDILAYDFKVDWWDGDYTIEEKRKTLKTSWQVHRTLGTKGAVLAAISAIYPNTAVEEWFEYGGEPYCFRLIIDATEEEINSERNRRVINRINYYKNLRSHLEGIEYIIRPAGIALARAGVAGTGMYIRQCVNVQITEPIDRPHAKIPVRAGIKTAGTYLKMEVTINGME